MSGFVALVNLDGVPIDDRLLHDMTASLAFRGPDAQREQMIDRAGLGYALLRVGDESVHGHQPFTLDGRRWLVADARIDGRRDLLARLEEERAGSCPADATDAELIARAYALWGEACTSRLLGDFSFVVWDADRQCLFGARDHLGIKPLFYARFGSTIAVSNTLECLRLHPSVSKNLNELAIADFLMFGENREADTTVFRDVRRLAPAHGCTWSRDATQMARYWTLPVDEPVHFAHASDYISRFRELLREAVADRLRTNRATVLMSGGLDSPTLAATAVAAERRTGSVVDAVTSVYERLIPDAEGDFAGLIAAHLNIPIRYDVRDNETSFADWDRVVVRTPEPVANPMAFAASVRFLETTAKGARVFLYGEGPDNALRYEWRPYLAHLARTGQLKRLARSLSDDVFMHPRLFLWSSIRQIATARRQAKRWDEQFPSWLAPAFSARCGCRDRWVDQCRAASPVHPVRPVAYASLDAVRWQPTFDDCDVTGARGHVEFRHPFLDVRLLRYLLALPAMPWCRSKLIIREAMRGALPNAVLQRKKTAVATSADFQRVRAQGLPNPSSSPELLQFVNPSRIPATAISEREMRSALRPLGLGYWLQHYTTAESKEFAYGFEKAVAV